MTPWERCSDILFRYRWLIGVLLLALVLDALFFTGYYAYDDKDYTWAAHKIAFGENFMLPRSENYELAAVRLAFTFPLGFVYWLSDGSVAWMSAFQMLYHLGCVVIAYALARMLVGEGAGRIAAVIAATCPLLYNFAGVMFPDVALGMWSGLSLLLLVHAIHRAKHPEEPGWRPRRLFIAAGLVLGIAYSIKATAILLCFPSAIAIIAAFPSLRKPMWLVHGAWLALGVGIVLLLEMFIFRALTGEWISQLTIAQDATTWDFPRWAEKQGQYPLERFAFIANAMREHMPVTFVVMAIGTIAYTISRKRNGAVVAHAWFMFIYLTIGTVSLSRYMPQPLFPRYFTPIIIPSIVALSCTLHHGYAWFIAWDRRPKHVSPRRFTALLVVLGAITTLYEVRANLPFSGSLGNSAWARSFGSAYEQANREYPGYPIVLSEEISYTLLPMLLPDIPDHVYWNARDVPWGDDGKSPPKPPFVFLDWTRQSTRSGVDRVADVGDVEIDTVAVVYPNAGPGLGRVREATHVLLGFEPDARIDDTLLWDATTIQLVRPATPNPDPLPIFPLQILNDKEVSVRVDKTGAALAWTDAGRFSASYFDGTNVGRGPTSPLSTITPPASQITVTLDAESFRDYLIIGMVEVFAYDEYREIISRESRPLLVADGTQRITATLRGNRPIHAYRVRWWINGTSPNGLHLASPVVTSVAADPTAPPGSRVVALTDRDVQVRTESKTTTVQWAPGTPRFAIQYFDERNYRRMPSTGLARFNHYRPVIEFTAAGTARLVSETPVFADVEVFAYGENKEISGRGTQRITIGPTPTSFSVEVGSERPAIAYRVRWWFEGNAGGVVELGPVVVTPIH